ncbi:hypothetical protein Lser_V15G25024 [Lactuca serriola]
MSPPHQHHPSPQPTHQHHPPPPTHQHHPPPPPTHQHHPQPPRHQHHPPPPPHYGTFPGIHNHPPPPAVVVVHQHVPPPGTSGGPSINPYVHGYQAVPGYAVAEGRPMVMRGPQLCCRLCLFIIIGFFVAAFLWFFFYALLR